MNFFDTAIGYQNGTSEEYLGRALKDLARREDVVVATKFPDRSPQEIQEGVSGREHVRRMLDESLSHLGMDYVDLYIYHMWDYATPLIEILQGLADAVQAGKARYIGISNCFAYQLAKANALAEREGFPKFVSVQGHYNLIFREEEREMAKLCREDNIAMTPYSALAGGRLAKRPGETSQRLREDSYAKLKYDATAEQDGAILARVAELADRRGVSMTEIALSWLLRNVTAPVVGATKLSHIEGGGQGRGPGAHRRGGRLLGRAVRSPQAGGGYGPEHPCRRRFQPGLDRSLKGGPTMFDLRKTDPEMWERMEAFAFREVPGDEGLQLEPVTRHLAILAALLGCQGLEAFREELPAALDAGVTPVMAKEVVYQGVDYLGLGRVWPFLQAANQIFRSPGRPPAPALSGHHRLGGPAGEGGPGPGGDLRPPHAGGLEAGHRQPVAGGKLLWGLLHPHRPHPGPAGDDHLLLPAGPRGLRAPAHRPRQG